MLTLMRAFLKLVQLVFESLEKQVYEQRKVT